MRRNKYVERFASARPGVIEPRAAVDSWIQKCLGGSLPGGGDGDDGGGGDEENREQLEHDEAESESGGLLDLQVR